MKLKNIKNVLVVSENRSFYDSITMVLPPDEYTATIACCGSEARRFIVSREFDILIVNAPLPDEHGLNFATDFIDSSMGILLVCPPERYDMLAAEGEDNGIVVLSSANPPAFIYIAVQMLSSMVKRLKVMEKKNRQLQNKMDDIRVVNKAKWALIDKKGMNEAEAHKYIEKMSMDRRMSRRETAELVLEMLE